ncbi:MAG: GMC oxidoreductase [Pseudomonadota bacterium]
MIIDFLDRSSPDLVEVDVCVVGAGPAGLAIAREFIGTRTRLCVVESGGPSAEESPQQLCEGNSVGPLEFHPAISRLRAFGGTGNVWGGGSLPLTSLDLTARDWVPHSGWPISQEELQPYYDSAAIVCGVGSHTFAHGSSTTKPLVPPLPLDDGIVENKFFATSGLKFGARYREELSNASGVTVLLHATVLELVPNESVTALHTARIVGADGRQGTLKARYFVIAAGGIENARLLLLSDSVATAGLGNDRGLVGRFFMDHPRGLIGKLTLADTTFVARPYDRTLYEGDSPSFAEISLTEAAQREHRILASRVHPFEAGFITVPRGIQALRALRGRWQKRFGDPPTLQERIHAAMRINVPKESEPPYSEAAIPALLWNTMRGSGDIVAGLTNRLLGRRALKSRWVDLVGYFEQSPNPDSRITLGSDTDRLGQRRVQIDWRLTALDRLTHRKAAALFGESLSRVSGGRFEPAPWLTSPESTSPPLQGTAHHIGTTRMATSPLDGVVDRDCRVHGIDNLFVAGSSVFPTGGWVFPTLTIVALSLRIAQTIKLALADRTPPALVARGAATSRAAAESVAPAPF